MISKEVLTTFEACAAEIVRLENRLARYEKALLRISGLAPYKNFAAELAKKALGDKE